MNRHHTGSGRRTVVPANWGQNHAPVAAGTMTASITLREPGGTKGPFDTVTGTYPITPHEPYAVDVACRVQALTNDARRTTTADDQVTLSSYLVSLPVAQSVETGHVGVVSGSGDPLLDGHELHVDDVVRGSLRFTRDLFCSFNS